MRATPVDAHRGGRIVVVAWMMPAVTAGMTWYASTTGGGTFAPLTGLPDSNFLDAQPLLIVTLANIWSMTGFAMLVMGAGLRNIPGEAIEAAIGRKRLDVAAFPQLSCRSCARRSSRSSC